jgi:hypothetical protein
MTMQTPHPMTREELLELSEADTLGMLDEYEAALFTRSFHHAPIAVQDEIRDLQEVQALNPSLLSDENPDPSLRSRVMHRIAQAVEEENSELAPLATIGRGRFEADRRDASFVLSRSWQFWRAASFAAAACLLVTLFFLNNAYRHIRFVTDRALANATTEDLRGLIGPGFMDFVGNKACETVALRPVDPSVTAVATVFIDPHTGDVFLVGMGLPTDEGPLTLQATLDDGSVHNVGDFSVVNAVASLRVDKFATALSATGWMLTNSRGEVLMQSA